jgi:hypothetical protein
VVFLGVTLLYGGEPWKSKTPDKWDRDDVQEILGDSPWGKKITTGFSQVREQDKTSAGGGRGSTSPKEFEREMGASEFARVIWWSAKVPRRAMVRMVELGGYSMDPEAAKKFSESEMEEHVVTIEDSMPRMMAAERLSPEELKLAAWLEIPGQNKRKVACIEAGVVKDARGRIERVRFHFPRAVDGQPILTATEKKVVFKWKLPAMEGGAPRKGAAPAEGAASQPKMAEAKQFEASFDPRKMVVNGALDN